MDRTFVAAAIVFATLGVVGTAMTVLAAQIGVNPAFGPALLGGGLAAFLVQAFDWDRRRTRS